MFLNLLPPAGSSAQRSAIAKPSLGLLHKDSENTVPKPPPPLPLQ
jgi:hypothetical protein